MDIFPAIDLHEGKCVRLFKGDFSQSTTFSDTPEAVAKEFEACGAHYLHLVDLDGALSGHSVHADIIRRITGNTSLKVELGGGIRSMDNIETALNFGLFRVILGSVAISNPNLVKEACREFGSDRIVVGIDARNGMVATNGWGTESTVSAVDLAKQMADFGVKTIIYTDISKDGTLNGINIDETVAIAKASGVSVVASGGVSSMKDVYAVKEHVKDGVTGLIIGKAIYTQKIDLKEALEEARA